MPRPPAPTARAADCTRRGALQALALLPLAACVTPGGGPLATEPPPDYAGAMRQVLQTFGRDLPGYQFRGTPIGNFGVGALYLDDLGDPGLQQVESRWFLGGPQTWLQPASAADRAQWMSRLVAEGSMGSVNLSHGISREVHASIGLSVLTALVGSAGIDYSKGVTTVFRADEARNRRLNWAEFEAALAAGRIAPAVAKVVRQGNFIVAAADLLLRGYQAEISVDEGLNPRLAASLRTNALLPQLSSASGGFRLAERAQGQFTAVASEPVVAAVLFKRPPPQSKSWPDGGGRPAIDDWPGAPISPRALRALDASPAAGSR